MVVYDITNKNSFERARVWIEELLENADASIIIALAGNKVDLESSRTITKEEAEDYARKNGLLYFECSAKTGENVKEIFFEISFLKSKQNSRRRQWE